VDLAVDALKKNGHNVFPWTPYRHDFAVDLINGIYVSDGCEVSFREVGSSTKLFAES
jgi:amidase